ncbi:MAG TPA: flagellar hook-basal body complex protein FliE [Burkholderiales bacterium]|nr:MAG: flagellar hook-basal body complex protein FliE [Acidobacteria bacterium RBG_16_64_8]HLF22348.1 flagellar hook-basal body complex protein FliE [Burkholderiales bacterium]
MIDAVSIVAQNAVPETLALAKPQAATTDFGGWLSSQIDTLNQQLVAADTDVRRLALGEAGNLHEVMMRLETAKLSLELAVQVRNRLLEGYQDILRMQI